ncbi:hypothetical protein ASPWEDRAFT_35345 [Aspergillus wentii DTO 134E9]|uniref:Uncharacterized protein n=1 Tax=Aspergillus wentii DTO 134E9 TaxID=1073089 RepID=A0A1L9S3J4_ASPWE|nr:uncharacterized protein ASPWEDRAFT_35345 [Aspergillus wentii DTO 134E9]KAI9930079.1 hypothetical protein MW887_011889 [Aspergillus wentii]OJJ41741.1 hypothetical protein ASPWEDRAFT_35345 [Aspergillus wentii DTO 134E9]
MSKPTVPITLSTEAIEDLIYDARSGDFDALKEDISAQSKAHNCPEALIVASAIDMEDEAEGGTGCCLLHYPAANGNFEILNYLLQTLTQAQEHVAQVINHRNHSGNTPLHWAALNTHLECVKALVETGADLTVKNDAGLDAIFLAERTAWSTEEGEKKEAEQARAEAAGEEDIGEMSQGRQVVEWLLSSDKGGELEHGVSAGETSNSAAAGDAMDEDEKK